MSEENKRLYQRFMDEVVNGKDLSVVDELISDDFVDHNPMPGMASTKAGMKQQMEMFLSAFPDTHTGTTFLLAEGDFVVGHHTTTGTNGGEFMGVPATGKSIEVAEIHIVRIVNGKAVEHWGLIDDAAMMQQMGLMPGAA